MSAPPSLPQDFTLSVSPQSTFLPIGAGSTSVQVSVQAVNGFTQPVSIAMSGLPMGVTTSPAVPLSLNPGSNQTIILTAAPGISPVLQALSIQAVSGTLNHSASISLSIANPSYTYVASGYQNQPPYNLVGFSVDGNTGNLAAVPGSAVSFSDMALDVEAVSEAGGAFVYALVPDSTSGIVTLNSYSVDAATGVLTSLQTISYPADTHQSAMVVHPAGTFLYVLQDTCVLAYQIDPSSGNLTQSSCSPIPNSVFQGFAIAPPGSYAYQTIGLPGQAATWYIYSVSSSDGSLTQLESYQTVSWAGGLFPDPKGRALYETLEPIGPNSCGSFAIWQIEPSTGALSPLTTSFSPLCVPSWVAFNPADTFAFVSSETDEDPSAPNGIYAATVNSTTGDLVAATGSPFASNAGAAFGSVEPTQGKFLLENVGGSTTRQVVVFAIDSSSGALSQVSGVAGVLPSNYALKMVTVAP
jgi:6-phosphogluconolactonase (cycloisomerase 2 family)